MKNGSFVLDAHTGFWDASKENCKNRFGEAFIETFYAFHTGFNPPEKKWTMDYETQFRKVDPDWYLGGDVYQGRCRYVHPLHPGADGLLPHRLYQC